MHHLALLPPGSRGLDQFIGEPEMIGRGHGAEMVRRHVEWLMETGVPAVGVDPDPDNLRAIRAYEKAGFRRGDVVETEWGPSLLMTRYSPDFRR
jgi:aminoglycoside 6'-N-acetyltransferase